MSTETLRAADARIATAEPQTWNVDASHSTVEFSVRHFFTPLRGRFTGYEVELAYDRESPEASQVRVRIPLAGIDTENEQRDGHLRSGDFFEAEAHPFITFESEQVEVVDAEHLRVRGPLTIKGVTREVELPVQILGVADLPPEMQAAFGGISQVASFEAKLRIDRRDFGVGVGNWAATAVVGSDVEIRIALEANR